jgi:FAD-dependent urate hydroxylase
MGVGVNPAVFKTAADRAKPVAHCDVAVIGAGPYGLAAAAHLKAANIVTQVFGEPMDFWRRNMPKGMKLRSPWRASHIADPVKKYSLEAYTSEKGLRRTENFPLDEFVRYGEWFQSRLVPDLDRRKVLRVEATANGFRLRLEDGDIVDAKRVVIAMGLRHQEYRPPQFDGLRAELVSHSSEHAELDHFKGMTVAVIGRGQSACETAVLLHEVGAKVELISRGPVRWIGEETSGGTPAKQFVWDVHHVMSAPSAVGPFPLNWIIDAPDVMRYLPNELRNWISTRSLRPAASAWLRQRGQGMRFNAGRLVVAARRQGSQIALTFDDGSSSVADHVLLATGYRMDIAKFGVLAPDLLQRIDCIDGYPKLSTGFQSSVPGLHFIGSSAVKSFGGLMRFVAGAGYAARNLTRIAREPAR